MSENGFGARLFPMFGIPFLTPTLLGAIGIAIVASLAGGFLAHELDQIPLNQARTETVNISAAYAAYKGAIAAKAAADNAIAIQQIKAASDRQNALQAELLQTKKDADARSKALLAQLNAAKPTDTHVLGVAVLAYLDGVRHSQAAGHTADPGNP